MELESRKTLSYYMRVLHRDIGFFIIGLTIIYSLSGILLIYRNTSFLKTEETIEKQLAPNLDMTELGKALRIKELKITKNYGDIIYFQKGTYNKSTGVAIYTSNELPEFLNKLNVLHKSSSSNWVHILIVIYATLLLFMAISSFWMYKPGTKLFRRGLYFACGGVLVAFIVLII